MIVTPTPLGIALFLVVVAIVVGISIQLVQRTTSPSEYFVAGGTIHWSVNGFAFIGDYLSAASFLGIGGLIATVGYDGFLYSVGFLAGWVLALLVVAEPFRRLGRVTFTDALDARFQSPAVRLTAAISTLLISVCYLVPQMVGVGTLVTPLLGIPYYLGVMFVGVVVTIIVATSGMASTTYVQCFKGGALLVVSTLLALAVVQRGVVGLPSSELPAKFIAKNADQQLVFNEGVSAPLNWQHSAAQQAGFLPLLIEGEQTLWQVEAEDALGLSLHQVPFMTTAGESPRPHYPAMLQADMGIADRYETAIFNAGLTQGERLSPLGFLRQFSAHSFYLWPRITFLTEGQQFQAFARDQKSGSEVLSSGGLFALRQGGASAIFDFISLMVALVCGTAALPHILIRYYTVGTHGAARKSTMVALVGISLFYIVCLFLGLGALSGGHVNLFDSNMAIPLLARSFGVAVFAVVTAIALSAVLGSVSGLIIAASGAVAHDIMDRFMGVSMTATEKVVAGRMAAVITGCCAIYFGIVFEGMNVSYLAGLAFALAAAANLPALVMVIYWRQTTSTGVVCSMAVGLIGSLVLIMLSPEMYVRYGLLASDAPFALNNPAIVMLPLSWFVLFVISRLSFGRC